ERLDFEMAGSTANVSISSNVKWTVTGSADWVGLSPVEGERNGSVQVTVGRYEVQGSRSATITVRGEGGVSKTIAVVQQGPVPFNLNPSQVNLGSDGGTFEVQVSSSYPYHINSLPDWVTDITGTTQPQNKIHKFQVGSVQSAEGRNGIITFCDDKGTCLSVAVRQEGDPDIIDWSKDFYHKSLFLQFTSTYWGSHPELTREAVMAQAKTPGKLEIVSVYKTNSELAFAQASPLMQQFGVTDETGAIGFLDGRRQIFGDRTYIVEMMTETEQNYPVASAIGFQSSFSGNKLNVDVRLYMKESGDYKVTVLLLESGVIGYQLDWNADEQQNYQYQHDNVARISLTNVTGDAFTAASKTIKKLQYSVSVPSSYNKDNLRILVVVQRAYGSQPKIVDTGCDFGDYYVDNCVSAKAGTRLLPMVIGESGGGNEGFIGGNPINW
ncbi:MAG: Omp28-related outer membrane protein, partial [Bacteroidales bacterium]